MSENVDRPSDPSRARKPRYELRMAIPILVQSAGQWHSGRLRNVSTGGAFISVDGELWVGEQLEIVVRLPQRAGGRLQLQALTVWQDPMPSRSEASSPRGYGVLFLTPAKGKEGLPEALQQLSEAGWAERESPSFDDAGF